MERVQDCPGGGGVWRRIEILYFTQTILVHVQAGGDHVPGLWPDVVDRNWILSADDGRRGRPWLSFSLRI